jgi:hypothetical protein
METVHVISEPLHPPKIVQVVRDLTAGVDQQGMG